MRASEAAEVLLVRAVEEAVPERISAAGLEAALRAAGDLDREDAWLLRRARSLTAGDLAAFRTLADLPAALARAPALAFAAALAVGALANTLGPGGQIHVLYNPIALLVVWNVVVLAGSGLRRALRRRAGARARGAVGHALARRLLRALWVAVQRAGAGSGREAREVASVARAFFEHASAVYGAAFEQRLSSVLHAGALGLVLGAVGGMFVRGVFLEYDVVWRSTFLRDAELVGWLLAVAFGPAAWITGDSVPGTLDARALMTFTGLPAARWLALHAVTAGLFALLPRGLLLAVAVARLRRLERSVALDTSAPYFRERLDEPRRRRISEVEASIGGDVRAAGRELARELADFACERLYDARLVPVLEEFRRRGGRLADLDCALARECTAFAVELEARVPDAIGALQTRLASDLARRLGAGRAPEAIGSGPLRERVLAEAASVARGAGAKVGVRISDGLGVVVSGAAAAAAGTVAGGFGKALGVAVVSTLLGTTGPIGFLIGAAGGLAVAGAGWRVARAGVASRLRDVALPALAVRTLLWRARFERLLCEGRERCRAAVETALAAELETLLPRLAEEVFREVRASSREERSPR